MLPEFHKKERGQILIILTAALIVLLAFTSLAIDGGMIYSDRRQAQNAADAAALAGSLAKANGGTDAEAIQAATDVIVANDYGPDQVQIQVSNTSDLFGAYHQVRADLEVYTQTSLMHLFGHTIVTNEVMAIAKTRAAGPVMPGMAIIAMGDCKAAGGPRNLISIDGGGNSGEVLAYNGGIFLNSTDPSSSPCAIDPPRSNPSLGVVVHDGHVISSVGQHTYPGANKISPAPIQANVNSGVRIGDPLEGLEEPLCTSNGSRSGNVYQPGRYGGAGQPSLGAGTLNPGIYCITGDLRLSGQDDIAGNGVVLYFINGGTLFTGQGALKISAPTGSNCLGTEGDRTASCTYKGIAMFMARGQKNTFDLRGNGNHKIVGTVYALDGDVIARGGGRTPDEWMVNGQVIARSVAGDGSGSFTVTYNENNVYRRGPGISLTR
ncbi:MAG TPA: pilus assembly protein TadG-related protein [Levilinea sp.]|nr:pilus assembly protein TadG-related protein [Levilinea sp.]